MARSQNLHGSSPVVLLKLNTVLGKGGTDMGSNHHVADSHDTEGIVKKGTAEVSIVKATYSAPGIEPLLEPLGGMGRFIDKGDRVLLKVNLLSARKPEEAVTTHPDFVRAVASAVRKAGGHPCIGDSPSGTFSR